MLSLNEAREFLRIDGTENDNIINALLNAIPSYIEITTGMTKHRAFNKYGKQIYIAVVVQCRTIGK